VSVPVASILIIIPCVMLGFPNPPALVRLP